MDSPLVRALAVALSIGLAFGVPAGAERPRASADSARISAVLAGLDSAWHAGDADRWVAHYGPDADFIGFVNISGTRMTDLATLRGRLAQIFGGIFRGSRHVGTLRRLRFLGAGRWMIVASQNTAVAP